MGRAKHPGESVIEIVDRAVAETGGKINIKGSSGHWMVTVTDVNTGQPQIDMNFASKAETEEAARYDLYWSILTQLSWEKGRRRQIQ